MEKIIKGLNAIIIAICSFIIIVNLIHYFQVRYSKEVVFSDNNKIYKETLDDIDNNLDKFDLTNYNGKLTKGFLNDVYANLNNCLVKLKAMTFLDYTGTKRVNIKDIARMYNNYIANECSEEMRWFYDLNDSKDYTSLDRAQFTKIAPYIQKFTYLYLFAGPDTWEYLIENSHYYLHLYSYPNYAPGTDPLASNYWQMLYASSREADVIEELSDWLLDEIGGGNNE